MVLNYCLHNKYFRDNRTWQALLRPSIIHISTTNAIEEASSGVLASLAGERGRGRLQRNSWRESKKAILFKACFIISSSPVRNF